MQFRLWRTGDRAGKSLCNRERDAATGSGDRGIRLVHSEPAPTDTARAFS